MVVLTRRSYPRLLAAAFAALVAAGACGGNPEAPIPGGSDEFCTHDDDCPSDSVCSSPDQGTCTASCRSNPALCSSVNEICLADGRCSSGLGSTCSSDDDCNDGLRCSDARRCAEPCSAGDADACGGKGCGDDGTCPLPGIDLGLGGASGVGGADGAGGESSCIDVNVEFEPQVPTVLLLIDRSGSMTDESGFGAAVQEAVDQGEYALGDCAENNDWRWNVVRDVLFNPTKGVVKPLEDRVRFGMSLYTSTHGIIDRDSGEVDPGKTCPELINVPIALSNHAAMLGQYACGDIGEDTPTGESLSAAAATLNAFTEPGPKIIVLATDGEPDTCACPDFSDGDDFEVPDECEAPGVPDDVKDAVVATAGEVFADGITVHVINVSTPSNMRLQEHLAAVAEAGGGEVYPGFSPSGLIDAFQAIIDGARSCKIDLDGEIAMGEEDSGTVTLDGSKLVLNDPDGWQVNSPTQIELLGDACETIKGGDHDLVIKFPCDSFRPPPK